MGWTIFEKPYHSAAYWTVSVKEMIFVMSQTSQICLHHDGMSGTFLACQSESVIAILFTIGVCSYGLSQNEIHTQGIFLPRLDVSRCSWVDFATGIFLFEIITMLMMQRIIIRWQMWRVSTSSHTNPAYFGSDLTQMRLISNSFTFALFSAQFY